MGDQDTGTGMRWVAVAALAVLAALGIYTFMGEAETAAQEPDAAVAAPSPAAVTRAAAPSPTTTDAPDADADDDDDDAPLATQPRAGEYWARLRVPMDCTIEPPLAGAAVEGEVRPVTWPGPDHEPQEGGLSHPAIPMRMTVEQGLLIGKTFLPAVDAGDEPIRHVATLRVPGFAPTEFSFITTGPDQPAVCTGPIHLTAAANGVVGTVRFADDRPAEGAIVAGCGARAVTGGGGAYFLLPRVEEPCSLRARHAPGSAALTAPQSLDPSASEDHVADFVVALPERPTPGVELLRSEENEVWALPGSPDDPWATKLLMGAKILRVGDVPAHHLSDDELLHAMVQLDQPIHVQQFFETEDGESVLSNVTVSEL